MDMTVLVGGAVCVNDDAATSPTVALEIVGGVDEDGRADGEAVAATAPWSVVDDATAALDEATGCAMVVRPGAAARGGAAESVGGESTGAGGAAVGSSGAGTAKASTLPIGVHSVIVSFQTRSEGFTVPLRKSSASCSSETGPAC